MHPASQQNWLFRCLRILVANRESEIGLRTDQYIGKCKQNSKVIAIFCLAAVTFRWTENYSS